MNAKIKVKNFGNGGTVGIYMKLEDENGNHLSENKIENILVEGLDELTITVDEVEVAYQEEKSHLYQGGAGMHEHQIYKTAIAGVVRSKLPSRKWIIS